MLIGHTRDEYSLFNPWRAKPLPDSLLTDTINLLAPRTCGLADYRAAYPAAGPSQLYETVNADWLFRMPCQHLAAAQHAGGGTAWLYELTWNFNTDEGSSHSLDMLLIFGTLTPADITRQPTTHPDTIAEYERLSRTMRTDWVRFAADGPSRWSHHQSPARTTRVYATEPTDQPYPEEASRRLWSRHRFTTLDLAT